MKPIEKLKQIKDNSSWNNSNSSKEIESFLEHVADILAEEYVKALKQGEEKK